MGNLGTTEILIIAGVLVLLFGATKLPQMARSLGQSARVFKAETRGLKEDDENAKQEKPETRELNSGQQESPRVSPSVEETQQRHDKN